MYVCVCVSLASEVTMIYKLLGLGGFASESVNFAYPRTPEVRHHKHMDVWHSVDCSPYGCFSVLPINLILWTIIEPYLAEKDRQPASLSFSRDPRSNECNQRHLNVTPSPCGFISQSYYIFLNMCWLACK